MVFISNKNSFPWLTSPANSGLRLSLLYWSKQCCSVSCRTCLFSARWCYTVLTLKDSQAVTESVSSCPEHGLDIAYEQYVGLTLTMLYCSYSRLSWSFAICSDAGDHELIKNSCRQQIICWDVDSQDIRNMPCICPSLLVIKGNFALCNLSLGIAVYGIHYTLTVYTHTHPAHFQNGPNVTWE